MIQNWKRKLKKKNWKKIEKKIFRGKKTQKNLNFLFFFGKMKKSGKNNSGKCAIFFNQKPEIGKTEKSKFLDIFAPFMCTPKVAVFFFVNRQKILLWRRYLWNLSVEYCIVVCVSAVPSGQFSLPILCSLMLELCMLCIWFF